MRIIFEDNHLLVINKDAGVLVQGDKTGDTPLSDLAKAYVKEKYQKPGEVFMGVIHRIDRPVSGLVLMARTSKALERMNEQFKNREIEKKYLAVVRNRPPANAGNLVHWLIKNPETIEVTLIKKQGSIKQTGMAEMRIAPRYSDTPGKTWYEFSTNACNYDFDISKNTLVLSAFDCKNQVKDFKLVFTKKSFKRLE